MSLLVVGSIALDTIKTPMGQVEECLGGSATYFACAASFFGPVRLVGVVGGDFPPEHLKLLGSRGIDTRGVEIVEGGKTFRWTAEYFQNMNDRQTLSVELNVLGDHLPRVPGDFGDSRCLFLANGPPATQSSVLDQAPAAEFVMCDTMDLWIRTEREGLDELLRRVQGLFLNAEEAVLLTEERNLIEAGLAIRELGPQVVIVKKGEHGSIIFSEDGITALPAYPAGRVRDPTGAGDVFAGGVMGYLAQAESRDGRAVKRAVAYGTVLASFIVEDFSLQPLLRTERSEVDRRTEEFIAMLRI